MEQVEGISKGLLREIRDLLRELRQEIHAAAEADRAWRARQLEREHWLLNEVLADILEQAASPD